MKRMKLTEEQVKKYIAICREYLGRDVSFEEAYEEAAKLVNIMRVICRANGEDDPKGGRHCDHQ